MTVIRKIGFWYFFWSLFFNYDFSDRAYDIISHWVKLFEDFLHSFYVDFHGLDMFWEVVFVKTIKEIFGYT